MSPKKLHISHKAKSYRTRRIRSILGFLLAITIIEILLLAWLGHVVGAILFFIWGMIKLLRAGGNEPLYLYEIELGNEICRVNYFNKKDKLKLEVPIKQLELQLIDRSYKYTRFELVLIFPEITFSINNDYGWKLEEIKKIYTTAKELQNEPFTLADQKKLNQIDSIWREYDFSPTK